MLVHPGVDVACGSLVEGRAERAGAVMVGVRLEERLSDVEAVLDPEGVRQLERARCGVAALRAAFRIVSAAFRAFRRVHVVKVGDRGRCCGRVGGERLVVGVQVGVQVVDGGAQHLFHLRARLPVGAVRGHAQGVEDGKRGNQHVVALGHVLLEQGDGEVCRPAGARSVERRLVDGGGGRLHARHQVFGCRRLRSGAACGCRQGAGQRQGQRSGHDAVFPSKRSHARPFERFRPFYHDGGHGGRRPASLPLLLAADGCGVMDKKSAIPWIFLAPERICERFSRKRLFNCTKTESFSKGDKESRRFCPVAGRRFRPAKVAFCSGSGRRIPPAMCVLRAFFLRLDAV